MFKAARWRSEKSKISAVFKLQLQATQVPVSGWETMMVTLVPMDAGTPTSRSEKAPVIDGKCHWTSPIYETVKLSQDPKTRKISDKVYQFLVSATGSTKSGVVGEIAVNLADHAEALKPSTVSRPLNASSTGAILHVTVQRMQGDAEGRVADDSGDVVVKKHRRTLQSQLSISDDAEGSKDGNGANGVNSTEDGAFINNQSQVKFPSSRTIPPRTDSDGNLTKSSSFDAISASGSDTSSGQYTPKEIGIKNATTTYQESASFLSRLSSGETPAPDGSTSGSTSSSVETGSSERLQESDGTLENVGGDIVALRRQLEVSDLELQTLRKQVVKENRRGQDLSREVSRLKEEREALARECDELKGLHKGTTDDNNITDELQFGDKDPWSMLEEAKQELNHEKNVNANLRLQLQKTQDSNSELILAVRDLDELLEQKNQDMCCINCSTILVEPETNGEVKESQQESFETISENDEQCALEILVNDRDDLNVACSLEQQIIDLSSIVELYKKDREEIETQMEQLALDYEILKQENHDISSKLEQTQLREQLRMQYECSGHLAIISDLETYVESLENELQKQAEAFEADLAAITDAKVSQEQRAIQAEEALRKTRTSNASTIERLQEESKRLCAQMSTAFNVNEKLVMEALDESSELRLQKSHVEERLEKSNEELASVKGKYHVKFQQLLCLVDFKTKETDRLLLELKGKRKELENQKKSEETRQRASSEEMVQLKAEVEKALRENKHLSEQIECKEKTVAEMEQMKTAAKESEMLLQERNLQRDTLQMELGSTREEVNKTLEQLNEKDIMIRDLNSEIETLRRGYSDLEHTLSEDALEKANLRKWLSQLKKDLQKKEVFVTCLHEKTQLLEGEIKLKDAAVDSLRSSFLQEEKDHRHKIEEIEKGMKNFSGNIPGLCEGMVHKGNLYNGHHEDMPEEKDIAPNSEELSSDNLQEECGVDKNIVDSNTSGVGKIDNCLLQSRIEDKACINIGANTEKDEETLLSSTSDQQKICDILSEMALLKKRNQSMETELKEMQERYSDMSLKFAEVEGERQQLVINIRTLKNALKN